MTGKDRTCRSTKSPARSLAPSSADCTVALSSSLAVAIVAGSIEFRLEASCNDTVLHHNTAGPRHYKIYAHLQQALYSILFAHLEMNVGGCATMHGCGQPAVYQLNAHWHDAAARCPD